MHQQLKLPLRQLRHFNDQPVSWFCCFINSFFLSNFLNALLFITARQWAHSLFMYDVAVHTPSCNMHAKAFFKLHRASVIQRYPDDNLAILFFASYTPAVVIRFFKNL